MPQTKNRLEAFGALRALCCLSVILLHTHVTTYTAYLGVTTFFIMSGFLLVYNYYDRTELDGASLSLCFRFAHGKVKKLYPLHLLTMALFVAEYAYALITGLAKPTLQLFAPFIANVLLIQTWFPSEGCYFSFNIVSWYLSVSAFLYFMFPLVLKAVRRLRSTAQAAVLRVLLFAVQAAASYYGCGSAWLGALLGRNGGTVQWLLYVFPPMRLPAFWIGCNLGYIFLKTEKRVFTKAQTAAFEALTVLAAACSLCTGLLPKSAPRLPAFFMNGVAWYMSTSLFLYMAFPYIIRRIRRRSGRREAWRVIIITFFAQAAGIYLLTSLAKRFVPADYYSGADVAQWLAYVSPFSRIADFIIACNFAYLFKNRSQTTRSAAAATAAECGALILAFVTERLFELNMLPAATIYCTAFIPAAALLIWEFARGEGYISRAMNNAAVRFIAALSPYVFLIHPIVIMALTIIITRLPLSAGVQRLIFLLTVPLFTFSLSVLYRKFERRKRALTDSALRS